MENLRQPKVGDVWELKTTHDLYTVVSIDAQRIRGRHQKTGRDYDLVNPRAWKDQGAQAVYDNFYLLTSAEDPPSVGDAVCVRSTGEFFVLTSVHVTPVGPCGEPPQWRLKGRFWPAGTGSVPKNARQWRYNGPGSSFTKGHYLTPKSMVEANMALLGGAGIDKLVREPAHGMPEWARNMTTKIANHAFLYGMGSAQTIFSPGQQAGRNIGNPQIKLYAAALNWTPPFGPVKPRLSAGWEHLPCVTHPELPAEGSYWEDVDGTRVFCSGRVWQSVWGGSDIVEKIRFYLLPRGAGWIDRPLDMSLDTARLAWPRMKPLLRTEGACPHDRVRPYFYKGALAVGVDFAKPAEVSRDTQAVTVGSYWRGKTTGTLTYVLDLECDRGIRVSRQEYVRGEGKVWGRPITVRSAKAFCRNYFLATEPSDDHRHSDDPKFLVKPAEPVIEAGSYWTGRLTGTLTYVQRTGEDGSVHFFRRDVNNGGLVEWSPTLRVWAVKGFLQGYEPHTFKEPFSPLNRHPSDPKFVAVKPAEPAIEAGSYWRGKGGGAWIFVNGVCGVNKDRIYYARRVSREYVWSGVSLPLSPAQFRDAFTPATLPASAVPWSRHPSDPKFIAAPPPAPVLPKRHDYFWKKNVPVGTATLIHVYDVNEAEGYVLFHEKKMEPGAKWSWNQYASGGLENWVKSYTTGRRFKMLFWENMHPTDPDKAKAQARQMPAPKPTPKPVGDALFWLGAEGE